VTDSTRVFLAYGLALGLLLGGGAPAIATGPGEPAGSPDALPAIVRQMLEQHRFVVVPKKGSVDRDVKKGEPVYDVPGGPSPAALFELPTGPEPYELLLKSESIGKSVFTIRMFVPQAVVFDADLRPVRELPEAGFRLQRNRMNDKKPRVQLSLTVDPSRERYLLVFTAAQHVGKVLAVTDDNMGIALGAGFRNIPVARALDGKLRIDVTAPIK
jgi:hypothetical protein